MERPTPELTRPDQVLVKIEGAGVCATDLHAIEGEMEPAGLTLPIVLGHENAGRIAAVGDLVSTVAVGDPVLIAPPHTCGLCVACRRGRDMMCEQHEFTGLTVDGGFAEYVVVSERSIVPLPAGLDPVDVAPYSDAGITAYHAVKRLAHLVVPGSTIVAIGIGGVGHVGLQLLRELGSGGTIVAVEPSPTRRALAAGLGADAVLDAESVPDAVRDLSDGRGADLVMDFVGSDQTHADGMGMLTRGGTYSIVGFGGTVTVPSAALVGNENTIVGNLVGSWIDLWEVLQLHARGKLTLKTERHSLDDVNDVLAKLREGEVTGRAVLVPDSSNGRERA
ncbi:MAG TPA: alcohol dehydrogenase catalytic domain-containing protein [Methylomirabilota bacterium]|nr:alcohol dehydrogenase catalytic domain-containing protein [Methylomirabilota bacterium]